ncbi:J domain-containing protein [Bradyrhizobium sp. WSM 1738]|uniref:J domain-containing protein n=1 Tax=Bradyrhizobium hereditatis TaxID=2821405 RepID=UPI001CE3A940|nr:J domain-containing protein [Bradyrhizobium hereditatis]MCA6117724.1 J domain-containing protein [Bradyrhizobium hereditatis]
MGTLYDLLGALPSDDAEELRTAFRKAAKATHPDLNPDNPEAAQRFRELVRAYDILTDNEQRATYDHLLAIALQPEPATKATRTYETMHKVASNTMAATIISAVLVGGYTLFGLFSKPVAAEMPDGVQQLAALQPDTPARDEARSQQEKDVSITGAATLAAEPPAKETGATPIGRFEPVAPFATYNLGVQYYPRFAAAYFDRGFVLYRAGDFDRPLADITSAKRPTELKRTKNAASPAPVPRKPLMIVPSLPERREPMTAALTP